MDRQAVDLDRCAFLPVTDPQLCGYYQSAGTNYDLSLGVDAGGCEARPTVACDGTCGAGPTLYSQMSQLLGGCGFVPAESMVGVTFSQGCAQHVSLSYLGPDQDTVASCILAALSASRFSCAELSPCWGAEFSTLAH